MIVEVNQIFTINPTERTVGLRHTSNFELETATMAQLPEGLRTIHVARGLSEVDFGLFITAIDNPGVSVESFLMTSYMQRGRGLIMPSDEVADRPDLHMTTELARKIACVAPEEIEQFGLECLTQYVKKKFPGIT